MTVGQVCTVDDLYRNPLAGYNNSGNCSAKSAFEVAGERRDRGPLTTPEGYGMLKAILKKGVIVPVEPVPAEWEEGTSLQIEKADLAALDINAWAGLMDRLCAASSVEEEEKMLAAIDEQRRQAKAQTRRDMGLPE